MWKCPRCHNDDQNLIFYVNNIPHCKRCSNFKKEIAQIDDHILPKKVSPTLHYSLSLEQDAISKKLVQSYHQKQDVLVHAVCGAGKTEIVLAVIATAIEHGARVGFIIPRRQVVMELYKRLINIFPTLKVTAVYGGHNQELDGDLIVLTAHQSYLYPRKFGLTIVDEVDAFPYYKNETLQAFVEQTNQTSFIYLSATPPKEYQRHKVVTLMKRYHQHPLPEPKLLKLNSFQQYIWLFNILRRYEKEHKPCFVYLPTIALCKKYYQFYKIFFPHSSLFHSKSLEHEKVEQQFRQGINHVLFATTILERGITFANLQVIVIKSDHPLFNEMNLVQIAGRVGRTVKYPTGEVYFIGNTITSNMLHALSSIKKANEVL